MHHGTPRAYNYLTAELNIYLNKYKATGDEAGIDIIDIVGIISNLYNITIELMFAGINMFLARLRLILARAQRGLNEFEKGQKHIYAQEHQLYYYYNKFKGQYTA